MSDPDLPAGDRFAEWDAAYVLGALSTDERLQYEAHLAGCSACSAAVGELTGLPGLLGRLDGETAATVRDAPEQTATLPDGAASVPLLASRIRRARTRRRVTMGVGLAAAVAVGAALGTGLPQLPAATAQAATLRPVADSGLTAHISVTPVAWGTRLTWSCDYRLPAGSPPPTAYPDVEYSLVVTTRAGRAETVATWESSGGEATDLAAATHVPSAQIRSIDIRVTGTAEPLAAARLG